MIEVSDEIRDFMPIEQTIYMQLDMIIGQDTSEDDFDFSSEPK